MDRKGGSTAVVTAELVTTQLRTVSTTPAEEKALRMRYGAKVGLTEPLPQAHGGNEELADELLLLEMRLLKAVKMHRANLTAKAGKATAVKSVAKDKIVRGLKAKKSR